MKTAQLTTLILMLALYTGLAQSPGIPPGAREALRDRQKEMLDIFSNGDADGFRRISGDDYLTINADGTYLNKEETAAMIGKFKGSRYEVVSQDDRFYDPIAISTGRIKFYMGSMLVADVYATQTWIYRNGRWEYIGWHGTMTGTPKNYPMYAIGVLICLLVLIYLLFRMIRRRRARRKAPTS